MREREKDGRKEGKKRKEGNRKVRKKRSITQGQDDTIFSHEE